jgi:hypothetical protein
MNRRTRLIPRWNVRDELAEWVLVLKCRRCSRVVDFGDVHEPTRRLTDWATCCGEVMELESVERSPANA